MARRNVSEGGAIDPSLSQKKRARRRLIGAAALALAAAIVLPLVLDSEPRRSLPDIEVRIPSRSTPVAAPPTEIKAPAVAPVAVEPAGRPSAAEPTVPKPPATAVATPPTVSSPPAESRPAPPSAAPAPAAAATRSAPAAPAPAAPPASGAREPAQSAAVPAGRFVVQLGLFSSAESAKALAERARKTGVKPYLETLQTASGPRTRVRVGPFPDREAADRVRAQLQLAGVEALVVVTQP